jgi:hypothetical protein
MKYVISAKHALEVSFDDRSRRLTAEMMLQYLKKPTLFLITHAKSRIYHVIWMYAALNDDDIEDCCKVHVPYKVPREFFVTIHVWGY